MTFLQFLEEMATSSQTLTISAGEVDRLVRRFGDIVRKMGQWNSSDGSLEIPISVVVEAARQVGSGTLSQAVEELKHPEDFVAMLHSSSAAVLIEKVALISQKQFRDLLTQLQQGGDPAEVERLKREVDQAIFGMATERICLTG